VRLADRSKVPRTGAPALPVPLWTRLDELVEQANEAGASTTRVELIAAWLVATTPAPEVMKEWVDAYRTIPVRKLVPGAEEGAASRTFVVRQAGRPRGH
jgi:hypothetical protein